jgi:hypothetical protein
VALRSDWDRLLSEARMLSQKSEIADSDQCWMLSEWIKYVADPTSQIIEPPQLGEHLKDPLVSRGTRLHAYV